MQIKRAQRADDIKACVPILLQLRPHYAGREAAMLAQIIDQQRQGFELHYLKDNHQVVACAGIRFLTLLAHDGTIMYVDDLITDATQRSHGYAKQLIDYLADYAKTKQCHCITLDSGVQRFGAHRFYLRERFDIASHHFVRQLQ